MTFEPETLILDHNFWTRNAYFRS